MITKGYDIERIIDDASQLIGGRDMVWSYSSRFDYEIGAVVDELTLEDIMPGEKIVVCDADLEDKGVKLWEEGCCYKKTSIFKAAEDIEAGVTMSPKRRKRIAWLIRNLYNEVDACNQTINL